MAGRQESVGGRLPFEQALNMTGYGVYSGMLTALAGLIVISLGCVAFGTTYIIPTSACELQTTSAQQGLISSAPLAGIILGAVVGGYLGDVYGRRRVLLYALVSSALFNGLASLSVDWVMLVVLQTVASFCASGQFSIAMALLSESVPMMKRNMSVLLVNSMFIIHQGIMAVIAMPVIPLPFSIYLSGLDIYWNSWRTLVLLFSVPSLLAAFWLLFLMESPKYVLAQGREEEAIHIIKTIHRINRGKSAGELKIEGLMQDTQDVKASNSARSQIGILFKTPLLKYTLILTALFSFQQHGAFTAWMPTIANQFIQVVQTGEGVDRSICGILDDSLDMPADVMPALDLHR